MVILAIPVVSFKNPGSHDGEGDGSRQTGLGGSIQGLQTPAQTPRGTVFSTPNYPQSHFQSCNQTPMWRGYVPRPNVERAGQMVALPGQGFHYYPGPVIQQTERDNHRQEFEAICDSVSKVQIPGDLKLNESKG